jgi:Ca-activated chloride channel family protein
MSLPGLTFAASRSLWLLVALPVVAWLGWAYGVKRGRFRRSVLLLRTLSVAMLIVALAQPLTAAGGSARSTIFVVDRSQSITSGNDEVDRWVNSALSGAGGGDQAAVIAFGSSPELAQPVTKASQIGSGWQNAAGVDPQYTDMESALALARALPVGGSRRIVLVSDGAENLGSVLNQVSQAAADGIPIDVLPLPGVSGNDLRVEGASAPGAIWSGDSLQVLASIDSGAAGTATVSMLVDGSVQASQEMTLQAGLNTVTLDAPNLTPGYHAISIQVASSAVTDAFPDDDTFPLAVIVRDQPKLLLIAPSGNDPGRLVSSLQRKGAVVTQTTPDRLSSQLPDLAVYDGFVLDNVPATAFTYDQLTGLQQATKSLGKGLVVIGGSLSYGKGGYAGSVLEDALPVTVKTTDGKQRQHVALLLIIDKSGSMSYDPLDSTSKIEMAKEAAKLAVTALADGDQIGVLAFSDSQQWVVNMTTIDGQATRDQVNAAIDTITADGGTEIFPALQEGFDAIRRTDADVRHVVLLSDGKSRTGTPASYDKEIDQAVADRTTLSTIAIGDDADQDLLTHIAEEGNGRYHFTDKPEDIPRLTLQEAQDATSQSVIRGTFHPIQTLPSPIMDGFKPEDLPALQGYDYAEPKPDAQVVLTSERDDPLLAKWQYGLGRVVAFTGDDGADFNVQWDEWSGFDDFWANMVRWSLPDPENQPMTVSVEREGPEAVVTVSSTGEDGSYVESAETTATVTGPDGAVTPNLPLYQSGPGQYQMRIAAPAPGAYHLQLSQTRQNAQPIAVDAAFTMPPSPELQPNDHGAALMSVIAQRTGGRVLTLDDTSDVFTDSGLTGSALKTYHPRWYLPLALALIALLTELALRLDVITRVRGLLSSTAP